MQTFFRTVLITAGSVLMLNTLIISMLSNINLGVIMPAIIGLPLFALGVFYMPLTEFFRSGILGAIIKWCTVIAYGLFGILFTSTVILTSAAANKPVPHDADALIVLGAGLRGATVSLTLKYRLDTAYDYLCKNPDTICIVSGGMGEGESVTESYAMKEYLTDRGISPERILEEPRSASTYENFLFSCEIIKDTLGETSSIAFVTTDFHVFRATLTANAAGIEATGIKSSGVWYMALNNHMRECAALVQYALSGKI